MAENKFNKKADILSDLWMNHRDNAEFQDFVEYNDIGLPMAFCASEDLARPTPMGKRMIEETYALLLAALDREDGDYESLDDLMLG